MFPQNPISRDSVNQEPEYGQHQHREGHQRPYGVDDAVGTTEGDRRAHVSFVHQSQQQGKNQRESRDADLEPTVYAQRASYPLRAASALDERTLWENPGR